MEELFKKYLHRKAPEFAQISGYLNTPNNNPLTLSSLKGKVVLVYIWTYICINSIRPMPYIHDWNQKYSDKGVSLGLATHFNKHSNLLPSDLFESQKVSWGKGHIEFMEHVT